MSATYLDEYFAQWDTDGSGAITRDEVRQILLELDLHLSDYFVDELIAQSDRNGDGEIDYQEFLDAFSNGVGIGSVDLSQTHVDWNQDLSKKISNIRKYMLVAAITIVAGALITNIFFSQQVQQLMNSYRVLIALVAAVVVGGAILIINRTPGLYLLTSFARSGFERFFQAMWQVFDHEQDYALFRMLGWTGNHTLIIRSEKMLSHVLRRPKEFPRSGLGGYPPFDVNSVLGAGSGKEWLKYRILFNDYFMKSYREDIPELRDIVEERAPHWHESTQINLLDEVYRIVVEIHGRLFFQSSFGCFDDEQEGTNFADLVAKILEVPMYFLNDGSDSDVKQFHATILNAIKQSTKPESIGHICQTMWEEGEFTLDEAIQHGCLYMLAQAPTMAIFWVLYRAASMNRCAELRDDPDKLLQAIKEELRIHPPVPMMLGRVALNDTQIGDVQIPADTNIWTSPFFIHHNPALWEDSAEFCPEQWQLRSKSTADLLWYRTDRDDTARRPSCPHAAAAAEQGKQQSPLRYVPFGSGQHQCQGRKFAVEEVYWVVHTILQHVDLTVIEDKGLLAKPVQDHIKFHAYHAPVHDVILRAEQVRKNEQ